MGKLLKAKKYLSFRTPLDFYDRGGLNDPRVPEWQELTNELVEEAIARQENNEQYESYARYVFSYSQYCRDFIKIKMYDGLKSIERPTAKDKIRVLYEILLHNFFVIRAINEKRNIVDSSKKFNLYDVDSLYKPHELRSYYIYFHVEGMHNKRWIELESAIYVIFRWLSLPTSDKDINKVLREFDGIGYSSSDGDVPTIHLYNNSRQRMYRFYDDDDVDERRSNMITHFDDCFYDYYEEEFKKYRPADLFGILPRNIYQITHTLVPSSDRKRYHKLFEEYYINLADNDPDRALLLKQTHLAIMLGYTQSDIGINLVGSDQSGMHSYLDLAKGLAGYRFCNLSYEDICSDKYVEQLCNSSLVYANYGSDDPVITSRSRVKQSIQGEMMVYNRPYRPVEKFATPDSTIIQAFNHMPVFELKNSRLETLLPYMTAIKFKQDQFEVEYKDLIDEITDKRAIPHLAHYLIGQIVDFESHFFGPDYDEFLDANGHVYVKDEDINLHGVYTKSYINRLRRRKLKHKI